LGFCILPPKVVVIVVVVIRGRRSNPQKRWRCVVFAEYALIIIGVFVVVVVRW
jgi:hypothetical protein